MKINFLSTNLNKKIFFAGENPTHIFAYDDDVSKDRRKYIREHFESEHLPNLNIFDAEGRLDEYELNKLIKSLLNDGKPSCANNKIIEQLGLTNLKSIGNNSYRAAMLYCGNIEKLTELKRAGIKSVVDIAGNKLVKEKCEEYGIKYQSLDVRVSDVFLSDEEALIKNINMARNILGLNDDEVKKWTEDCIKKKKENTNEYIKNFIEFIQTMQKGNVFIGCLYGSFHTSTALFFDYMFNPKAEHFACKEVINRRTINWAMNLYANMTEEDKIKMGWTKEFEETFNKRIKNFLSTHNY